MNTRIDLYQYKFKNIKVPTDSYIFIPRGKLSWFQTLLWKILLKTGCLKEYIDISEKIDRISFNRVDFTNNLYKTYSNMFKINETPKKIYMGVDQFNDLAKTNANFTNRIGFSIQFNKNEGQSYKAFGVPVEIIPWMDGVLIV